MAFMELATLGSALVIALAPVAPAAKPASKPVAQATAVKPVAYKAAARTALAPAAAATPAAAQRAQDIGDGDRFLYDSCGCSAP